MPAVTTTFAVGNHEGILYNVTPEDTPYLSMLGGLYGGEPVGSTVIPWQEHELRDAAVRPHAEGADAPAATNIQRSPIHNVLQIIHETVDVSYTKQATAKQLAAIGSNHPQIVTTGDGNPVVNELAWQELQRIKEVARDVEFSLINGTFQEPATNGSNRQTRGIIAAIETNVEDAGGDPLTSELVLDLLQSVWENGGIMETETATVMVNGFNKRRLTNQFITEGNYREMSRNVGGVNVQTIETDFGRLNVALNRYVPADTLVVVSLEQCKVCWLQTEKGKFFSEPLAKNGSFERRQLYGEFGLRYGNEKTHGKITNLATGAGNGEGEGEGEGEGG